MPVLPIHVNYYFQQLSFKMLTLTVFNVVASCIQMH